MAAAVVMGTGMTLAACGGAKSASPAGVASASCMKIAIVQPLSGAFASDGVDQVDGARLAAQEINASGGLKALGGKKVCLTVTDAGDTPATATAAARTALSAGGISAAVGSWYSSLSAADSAIGQEDHIPWISGSYTHDLINRGYQYVFQSVPGIATDSAALTEIFKLYLASGLKTVRVAIAMDNNLASVQSVADLKTLVKGLPVVFTTTQEWTPPLSDGTGVAAAVAASKPNLIYLEATSTSDATLVMRALKTAGSVAPVILGAASGGNPSYLSTVGATAMNGVFVPLDCFPGKGFGTISKQYEALSKEPFMDAEGLEGFTNVEIAAAGADAARSTNPQKIDQALHSDSFANIPGLSQLNGGAPIRFAANGRVKGIGFEVVQWQNGTAKVVYPPALAVAKPALHL